MKTLLDQLKKDLELAEKAVSDIAGPHTVKLTIEHKDTIQFLRNARIRWPATTRALIVAIAWLKQSDSSDEYIQKALATIEKELGGE